MNKKLTLSAIALVMGGLLIGGFVGHVIGSAETYAAKVAPSEDERAGEPDASGEVEFPVNESGETYGRGDFAVVPDLVLAYGDDGTEGYVRDSDLLGPAPSSPAVAAALNPEDRQVLLYQSDGQTVVGTLTVQGARPEGPSSDELAQQVSAASEFWADRLGISVVLYTAPDRATGGVIVFTSDEVDDDRDGKLQLVDGIVFQVRGGAEPPELQQGA